MFFKNLLTKVHRWLGLVVLIFLTLSGVTGTCVAFMPELDRWLNRDVIELPAHSATPLPFAELAKRVESRYKGAKVTGFFAGENANEAWLFNLKSKTPLPVSQAWVNPYTGDVLGERDAGKPRLDRRHLMPFIFEIHHTLMLDKTGTAIIGYVALGWLILMLAGVYLALYKRGVKGALTVARGASVFRTVFDLHRAAGLACSVFLVTMAFAALYLALPNEFRVVVAMFSPAPEMPVKRLPRADKTPVNIGVEQAMQIAQQQFPDAHMTALYLHPDKGVYQLRFRLQDDINVDNGTARVLVSTSDGRVVSKYSYRHTGSAGETLMAWMFPLHSGHAFGAIGRLMVALFGVLVPALGWTGFYFWYRRQAMMKKAARSKRTAIV
jgi:uncharacterized iron-regulated membrane protein